MISRREFIGTSLGAGVALALAPELLRAHQQSGGMLMQRAIPSSGEMLPVITFGARSIDPAAVKEILKSLPANVGRVVDVLHNGPAGEHAARTAADELGLQSKFFWTTPLSGPPPAMGGPAGAKTDPAVLRALLEEKLARFKMPSIDLVMVSATAAADDPAYFAVLQEMKKEGRVRYIGVHELLLPPNMPNYPYPPTSKLESAMRNGPVDFIGTDYHLSDRRLEEKVLPLAAERKIAAMAYFPLDRGRLLRRMGDTPLPEWAADFGAKTWAQFSLKYVLSHPAITVVRTGTTKAAHMLENIGAGIGPLPNEATRKRMAALVDSLPPTPPPGPPPVVTLPAALLDRYVGEYKSAAGLAAIFRRDGDKLLVTPGNNPETALIARSEIRFQDPRGPVFEFQFDAQGIATGAFLEQGQQLIVLKRVK